ncbi:MAG: hypothetical protein ABFS12_14685 [Bacteroidota bacterium]
MISILINKNYLLTLFFLIILGFNIYGQENQERKYEELKQQLVLEDQKLNSLNNLLKQKTDIISIEKSKPDPNEDKIQELLSSTANLTNSIDRSQLRINKLLEEFDSIKAELFVIYSERIDSVNNSNLSEDEKNKRNVELIEKRLLVSPQIDLLSFQPEKVVNIPSSEDSTEQKIYKEYLASALDEVEDKLTRIDELKSEIENIITLNEESSLFLEEVEFDSDIYSYTSPNKTVTIENEPTDTYGGDRFVNAENSLKTQTTSFSKILNQLKLNSEIKSKTFSLSSTSHKRNLYEFKELMDQVEKQLSDYKIVIRNKLKNQ